QQVDEHLGDLVDVAMDGAPILHVDDERMASHSITKEHFCAARKLAHLYPPSLEMLRRHPPQTRHQALESVDLLAADFDVLVVEEAAAGRALKNSAKEVDGVSDLVGDLGRQRLDQGCTFFAPGGGLLLAALLEL